MSVVDQTASPKITIKIILELGYYNTFLGFKIGILLVSKKHKSTN
jgi:hypothetical protein